MQAPFVDESEFNSKDQRNINVFKEAYYHADRERNKALCTCTETARYLSPPPHPVTVAIDATLKYFTREGVFFLLCFYRSRLRPRYYSLVSDTIRTTDLKSERPVYAFTKVVEMMGRAHRSDSGIDPTEPFASLCRTLVFGCRFWEGMQASDRWLVGGTFPDFNVLCEAIGLNSHGHPVRALTDSSLDLEPHKCSRQHRQLEHGHRFSIND